MNMSDGNEMILKDYHSYWMIARKTACAGIVLTICPFVSDNYFEASIKRPSQISALSPRLSEGRGSKGSKI